MVATLVLEASGEIRVGSSPTWGTNFIRSVAQSGSAPGLGPGGPRFESLYSDHVICYN